MLREERSRVLRVAVACYICVLRVRARVRAGVRVECASCVRHVACAGMFALRELCDVK